MFRSRDRFFWPRRMMAPLQALIDAFLCLVLFLSPSSFGGGRGGPGCGCCQRGPTGRMRQARYDSSILQIGLPGEARSSSQERQYCGWTKNLHHLENMGNHCWWVFTGESSFQGFLGGAYFCFVHPQYFNWMLDCCRRASAFWAIYEMRTPRRKAARESCPQVTARQV